MKKTIFKLTPLATVSVVILGAAMIVGCAGNGVKPVAPQSGIETAEAIKLVEQTGDITPARQESVQPEQETNTVMTENVEQKDKFPAIEISDRIQPEQLTFYFGFDKTSLSESDVEVIKQHAKFMRDNPGLILQINGHTDHHGERAYNEYLSKQRASEVAKILLAEGVTESQLVINALADDKPLQGESDKRKNRRVELEYQELNLVSSH